MIAPRANASPDLISVLGGFFFSNPCKIGKKSWIITKTHLCNILQIFTASKNIAKSEQSSHTPGGSHQRPL